MGTGSESARRRNQERCAENKEEIREYMKKYRSENRDKMNTRRRKKYDDRKAVGGYSTCSILKKHHEDMEDDPESLSTEFIQNLIGVECK